MPDRPNILSPALRERSRYIAYQVISDVKINFIDLIGSVWNSLLNLVGEKGTAESIMWIIKDSYDEEKQIGVIKCEHKAVEQIRSALALVQRVGEAKVVINVLGISGTIRGSKRKFLGEKDLSDFAKDIEDEIEDE